MKFVLSLTNKEITPWGGMTFLKHMLGKIGFKTQFENCSSLPVQQSNRGYEIGVIFRKFYYQYLVWGNRFLHTEVTHSDGTRTAKWLSLGLLLDFFRLWS